MSGHRVSRAPDPELLGLYYKCQLCNSYYRNKRTLSWHYAKSHSGPPLSQEKWYCGCCGVLLKTSGTYRRHIRSSLHQEVQCEVARQTSMAHEQKTATARELPCAPVPTDSPVSSSSVSMDTDDTDSIYSTDDTSISLQHDAPDTSDLLSVQGIKIFESPSQLPYAMTHPWSGFPYFDDIFAEMDARDQITTGLTDEPSLSTRSPSGHHSLADKRMIDQS